MVRSHIRCKAEGGYVGYSVHPLTLRQRVMGTAITEPSLEGVHRLPRRRSDEPCPIPSEHLKLLYQSFKHHERSAMDAVWSEEKCGVSVVRTENS